MLYVYKPSYLVVHLVSISATLVSYESRLDTREQVAMSGSASSCDFNDTYNSDKLHGDSVLTAVPLSVFVACGGPHWHSSRADEV